MAHVDMLQITIYILNCNNLVISVYLIVCISGVQHMAHALSMSHCMIKGGILHPCGDNTVSVFLLFL